MFFKPIKIESKKLRQSARNQECTINGPTCNRNRETTVLAHSPFKHLHGGGTGTKPNDIFACFACSSCHDALDGRSSGISKEDRLFYFVKGMSKTWELWVKMGLIKIEGFKNEKGDVS